MYQGLETTERAAGIGRSLDQHCQELESIRRKIVNPDVPPKRRDNLLKRLPVVKGKIAQLLGRLQLS